MPTREELRKVVFEMKPNWAPGPNGIGGKFYQTCFEIIKFDLLVVVQSSFCGQDMPKRMTHSCLILLPKTEHPNNLKVYRHIILSYFSNNIISKIMSTRLALILPNIISLNQSGFGRGRSIFENIMLDQEIIHGIKKPNEGLMWFLS